MENSGFGGWVDTKKKRGVGKEEGMLGGQPIVPAVGTHFLVRIKDAVDS